MMGIIRESFVIFKNWAEAINALPEEYQLETYKSLIQYGISGDMPKDISPVSKAMLISFSVGLENSICRYSASVENGKLGGRPSKSKNLEKPSETNSLINNKNNNLEKPIDSNSLIENINKNLEKPRLTQQNLSEPTHNLNDNENDNDNVNRENNLSLMQKKFKDAFPNRKIDFEITKDIDVDLLIKNINESNFLKSCDNMSLKSCIKNYDKIISGQYKDYIKSTDKNFEQRIYTKEEADAVFSNLDDFLNGGENVL